MRAYALFLLSILVILFSVPMVSAQQIQKRVDSETHALDRQSLAESHVSRYFFVRHAEKEKDGTNDPHLTPEGKARANRLAAMLTAYRIDAVYSTDFHRTRETARPTADAYKIPITIYDHKTVDIQKLVDQHIGKNILVVGHSNTIPRYVNTILKNKVYEDIDETDYGNVFILTIKNDEVSDVLLRNL